MFKYVRVLGHALSEQSPLLKQFLLILMRVLYQVDILSLNDISIVPVAEELDIRHQVNVGLPEAIFSLLVLVD